jgi:predicted secreted protein
MEQYKIMMNRNWLEKRTHIYSLSTISLGKMAFFLLSLCLLLGAVCAFRLVNTPIIVTLADNGKTIVVPSGNQVLIKLPTNAGSTGYTWNFTQSGNQNLLLQQTLYLPPSAHPLPGASGTLVFTFMSEKSGTTHLQFALQRSWEKNVPPIQHFSVALQVQP